ncbi:sodium-independent sulfate anion transporter-like [Lycorma delicatula]|uniref:sodium-independent sulfate anion transporter-like n=1 Tax=Lycorma delicatula TaxID=130591 RepID=UPI003F510FEF
MNREGQAFKYIRDKFPSLSVAKVKEEYVVNFISLPVAAGFINGASLNIIISLTPGLIGLPPTRGTFVVKLLELFHVISYTRYWSDFPLGITCIIILTVLFILSNIRIKYTCVEKTLKLISASSNAIIILSTTAATGLMDKYSEQPFIVVGTVKGGFRMPALPPFQTSIDNTTYNFKEMIFKLEGGLIAVPLVSALATISLAKSYS